MSAIIGGNGHYFLSTGLTAVVIYSRSAKLSLAPSGIVKLKEFQMFVFALFMLSFERIFVSHTSRSLIDLFTLFTQNELPPKFTGLSGPARSVSVAGRLG